MKGTKWTNEMILDWLEENKKNVKLVDGVYSGIRDKNLTWMGECGHIWTTAWGFVMDSPGNPCPICSRNGHTTRLVRYNKGKRVCNESKYKLLDSQFLGQKYKHNWLGLGCGHIFQARYETLFRAKTCPKCNQLLLAERLRKRNEEKSWKTKISVADKMREMGIEIRCVDDYQTAHSLLRVKCVSCGFLWRISWANFSRGKGCPECAKGKNEKRLGKVISELGIEAIPQFPLVCPKDVSKSGRVRVDYWLPELRVVVEYNGVQHYIFPNYFHKTKKHFESQIARDIWLRSNYSVIEVKFDEKNAEEFLELQLQKIIGKLVQGTSDR